VISYESDTTYTELTKCWRHHAYTIKHPQRHAL